MIASVATDQIGLYEPDRSLGVKSVGSRGRWLLCCLNLGKILLHTGKLRENRVCLCVYALEAKSILDSVSEVGPEVKNGDTD